MRYKEAEHKAITCSHWTTEGEKSELQIRKEIFKLGTLYEANGEI